jgi:hypothetical protein
MRAVLHGAAVGIVEGGRMGNSPGKAGRAFKDGPTGIKTLAIRVVQQRGTAMDKLRVSQLFSDSAGVLRWNLFSEGSVFQFTLDNDGMLAIFHGSRTERLSGHAVHASTQPKAIRAVYALCGLRAVREAMARLAAESRAIAGFKRNDTLH